MNSDEFDKYILVDGGHEKENDEVRHMRQPKTTKEQYKKMFLFVKDNNEGLIAKDAFDLLWENLASELNDIGPPDHTAAEWKKIWSEHKKRNRLDVVTEEASDQPQGVHPFSMVVDDIEIGSTVSSKRVRLDSDLSEKLSILIEKQNVLIGQHDTIIQKLEISNNLLQEIATQH